MPITALEMMGTRQADGQRYVERWLVSGRVKDLDPPRFDPASNLRVASTNEAWAAVMAVAPTTITHGDFEYNRDDQNARVSDTSDDPECEGDYFVDVVYLINDPNDIETSGGGNALQAVSVDISSETVNVKTGRHISVGGSFPDDKKGLIGATEDGVEGIDLPFGVYTFKVRKTWQAGQLPAGYNNTLKSLVGKVASNNYTNFEPGELKFLGATSGEFNPDLSGPVEFTYFFGVSRNSTEVINEEQPNREFTIAKKGWDVLDLHRVLSFGEDSSEYVIIGAQTVRPKGSEHVDFTPLGLGNI